MGRAGPKFGPRAVYFWWPGPTRANFGQPGPSPTLKITKVGSVTLKKVIVTVTVTSWVKGNRYVTNYFLGKSNHYSYNYFEKEIKLLFHYFSFLFLMNIFQVLFH